MPRLTRAPKPFEFEEARMAALNPPPDPFAAVLAEHAARKQAAQEQMQIAQMEYEQANSTPAERLNPMAAGFNLGLGRLGTVLAGPGGPDYASKARSENKSRNDAFLKARTDNLNRLRATYEAAANRAARIGDAEAETKARVAISKLDKDFRKEEADRKREADKAAADLEFSREKELIGLRGQEARKTNAEKPKTGAADMDEAAIASIGDRLENGEFQWPQVPKEIRGQVSQYLDRNKKVVLNQKGREATNKLNAMEEALREIQTLSQQVNTAEGPMRFGTGVENAVTGFLRTPGRGIATAELDKAREGYLALIARGLGEVGNLADKEQTRYLNTLPGKLDDATTSKNILDRSFRIIEKLRAKAIKTHTAPMGGVEAGGTSSTSNSATPAKRRVKWTTDASGNPVPVR